MQLDELADREATKLSGGQQQRLALARALVMEPALLLLDEPLSNLDAKLREQMRFELKRLQRELKITTVYVTHDQSEALALSHEIAVMNEGRIQQIGRPRDIYERPANQFVADFVGNTNFLDGTVVAPGRAGSLRVVRTEIGEISVTSVRGRCRPDERVAISVRPEDVELSEAWPVGRERLAGARGAEGVSRRGDRLPRHRRLAVAAVAPASHAAHAGRRRDLRAHQSGEVPCLRPRIRTVGVIGAGRIGQPIIGHLVRKGFVVVANDADGSKQEAVEKRGARWAELAELARDAGAILICVGYDRDLRALMDEGLINKVSAGTIVVVLSTVRPRTVQELEEVARYRGVAVVDATMCRGGRAADAGTMLSFVAGDPAVIERLKPVVSAYSTDIVYTGAVGTAQVAKAANNLLMWACLIANHEAWRWRSGSASTWKCCARRS